MQLSRKESKKFLEQKVFGTKSFCAWTTRLGVLVSATAKERLTGDVPECEQEPAATTGRGSETALRLTAWR